MRGRGVGVAEVHAAGKLRETTQATWAAGRREVPPGHGSEQCVACRLTPHCASTVQGCRPRRPVAAAAGAPERVWSDCAAVEFIGGQLKTTVVLFEQTFVPASQTQCL